MSLFTSSWSPWRVISQALHRDRWWLHILTWIIKWKNWWFWIIGTIYVYLMIIVNDWHFQTIIWVHIFYSFKHMFGVMPILFMITLRWTNKPNGVFGSWELQMGNESRGMRRWKIHWLIRGDESLSGNANGSWGRQLPSISFHGDPVNSWACIHIEVIPII